MGLKPVLTKAGISHQRTTQREGFLHLLDDDALYFFLLFGVDAEVEFVVYLENHLASDTLGLEALEDMYHRHLDDVGCGTLNGGVDGISLCKTSDGGVVRVDVWQITATPE